MKTLLLAAFLLIPALASAQDQPSPPIISPFEVFFSPKGGCTETVVKELGAAKTRVLVLVYPITSVPIAKAMVEAHKRGVKIQVILDKSQKTAKYSSADFVRNAGIPTFIDSQHAIAHNKTIIIDGQTVITGSFNITKQAENGNTENLLVIRDKGIADKYTENWKTHVDHAEQYEQREKGYSETQEKADKR